MLRTPDMLLTGAPSNNNPQTEYYGVLFTPYGEPTTYTYIIMCGDYTE